MLHAMRWSPFSSTTIIAPKKDPTSDFYFPTSDCLLSRSGCIVRSNELV